MVEMQFTAAVMRYGMPCHEGNENIREEIAITDILIMVTKYRKRSQQYLERISEN
jgi:hypothetical protein